MAAVTASYIVDLTPNGSLKELFIVTPATADPGDTIEITLADYGITNLLAIDSVYHTTDNSVIVTSNGVDIMNTSVSSGVLTITIESGTGLSNYMRVIRIIGGN